MSDRLHIRLRYHEGIYLKNYGRFFGFVQPFGNGNFRKKQICDLFCQRNEKITNLAIKIEKNNIFTKSTVNLIYFL